MNTETFSDLKFEEGRHIYRVGNKILPSVSSFISKFYEKFDSIGISEKKTKTKEEAKKLRNKWKEINQKSVVRGNYIHDFLEHYILNSELPTCPILRAAAIEVNKLKNELGYTTVANELRMYNRKIWYAGTADKIMLNSKKEVVIVDYKTNKDLFKNFRGKMMKYPFHYLKDCPYSHYIIQQNMYKLMLELAGFNVVEMRIIHFRHDGKVKSYVLPDIQNILREIFKKELSNDN